ncbi:MAG: glycosyltransferase, partial [Bdellovibrionales bacterium]|nr:glycosyltransferase [Bdellovibrionales bacterium]
GYQVIIASAAQNILGKEACERWSADWPEVSVHPILLNHSSFDSWIGALCPQLVIFDRFVTEEQFGWRVRQASPGSVMILDTQDLHFLRSSREKLFREALNAERWERVESGVPAAWETDLVCRELASLHRVDLAWLISDFEQALLINRFRVEPSRLFVSRFAYPQRPWLREPAAKAFQERMGFVQLGNFRHAPNLDAFRWLRQEVWPRIRCLLPQARVDVYGAYPTQEVLEANQPQLGFFVHGRAEDLSEVFRKARVSLAPLRFGAGIKGKIADSWWHGVPVVSTSIGSEGMGSAGAWGGLISDSAEEFATESVRLHESQDQWELSRAHAGRVLDERFSESVFVEQIRESILRANQCHLEAKNDWIRQMLNHATLDTYRYFGKWLELKATRGSQTS